MQLIQLIQIDSKPVYIDSKIRTWLKLFLLRLHMNNNPLDTARGFLEQDKFVEAQNYYDLYINELNSNLDFNKFLVLQEIKEEYIYTVSRVFNLDLSKSNPLYKKFDETKQLIQTKFENNISLTEYEENVRKLLIYRPSYFVHWGNYAGVVISRIIEKDPEYLLWCILNLDHFAIDKSIFLLQKIQYEPQYLNALLVNSIKHLIIEKWGPDDDDDEDEDDDYNDNPDDYDDGPGAYGYRSWDEMAFYEAFEGDIDAWNHYNQ